MILTEQQEMIRESAARFAEERLAPNSRKWEAAGAVDPEVLREMGELGFMGMTVPETYAGAGLDYVSYALALMEIAAGDGAVSTIMSVNNAPVCAILQSTASPALREQYLKPLAAGEMIAAFALTEPQAGSDAANLHTRATRSAHGYEITGTKQFITSGKIAGAVIVFAVTDPSAGKRGISAFVVPAGTAGMAVSSLEQKMGQEASDTAQLTFENATVPADHLIGAEGAGVRQADHLAHVHGIGDVIEDIFRVARVVADDCHVAHVDGAFTHVLADRGVTHSHQFDLFDTAPQQRANHP